MNQIDSVEELMELAWAFRASRVLQVAVRLGVFDMLSKQPLAFGEIAQNCECDSEMTEKLLIACTSLGLTRLENDKYKNSDIAEQYLVRGKPKYQGHFISHTWDLWNEWANLDEWIGGKPVEQGANGHRRFIMSMHDIAMSGEAEELATRVELKGRKQLLDVGGGPGTYSIILCKHNPQLRAIVFDLPETVRITREVVKDFKIMDRVSVREGDWNRDDFGGGNDVVLMSNVLHGFGSRADMKLRKAFRSMVNRGLLIIRDFVLNESKTGPLSPALFNIMVGAYSTDEISELIRKIGFINVKELDIPHKTHSILLAEKP